MVLTQKDTFDFALSTGLHRNLLKFSVVSLIPDSIKLFNLCPSTWLSPEQTFKLPEEELYALTTVKGQKIYFRKSPVQNEPGDMAIFPHLVLKLQERQNELLRNNDRDKYEEFTSNFLKKLSKIWHTLLPMYNSNCPDFNTLKESIGYTFRQNLIIACKKLTVYGELELKFGNNYLTFYFTEPRISADSGLELSWDFGIKIERILRILTEPSTQIDFEGVSHLFLISTQEHSEKIATVYKTNNYTKTSNNWFHRDLLVDRRDICNWVKTGYRDTLEMIINGKTKIEVQIMLNETINELKNENMIVRDVSFIFNNKKVIASISPLDNSKRSDLLVLNTETYTEQLMLSVVDALKIAYPSTV